MDPEVVVKFFGMWFAAVSTLLTLVAPVIGLVTSAAVKAKWLKPDSGLAVFVATLFPLTFHGRKSSSESSTILPGSLFIACALLVSGCAGTFEESSGKLQFGPRKAVDPVLCREISSRARWEKALAQTGAVLTGATGIAAWPVEGKTAETGLAIGATVLAGGTVLVLTLYELDAAAYIEAGCAQPKAVAQ
jgi:hypothetical protein